MYTLSKRQHEGDLWPAEEHGCGDNALQHPPTRLSRILFDLTFNERRMIEPSQPIRTRSLHVEGLMRQGGVSETSHVLAARVVDSADAAEPANILSCKKIQLGLWWAQLVSDI